MLLYLKPIFTIVAICWLFLVRSAAQSSEMYDGQLINTTDGNNLKQGLWVYFYDTLHTMVSCKGNFVDNKREGVWTNYYRSGAVKSTITFANNKESGYVKFYYENGNVSEEGLWINNHWVGEYRYYYSSGKLAYQWMHDSNGRRTGQQQYFYENGKLRVSGNWIDGKEDGIVASYYPSGRTRSESRWIDGYTHGVMKEFYEDGSLSAERIFNNGVYDAVASRVYREHKPDRREPEEQSAAVAVAEQPEVEQVHEDNPAIFSGTGYHKFINSNRQVDREGEFVNGTLMNGKRYFYDAAGKLIRIAVYENGRIVNTIDQ